MSISCLVTRSCGQFLWCYLKVCLHVLGTNVPRVFLAERVLRDSWLVLMCLSFAILLQHCHTHNLCLDSCLSTGARFARLLYQVWQRLRGRCKCWRNLSWATHTHKPTRTHHTLSPASAAVVMSQRKTAAKSAPKSTIAKMSAPKATSEPHYSSMISSEAKELATEVGLASQLAADILLEDLCSRYSQLKAELLVKGVLKQLRAEAAVAASVASPLHLPADTQIDDAERSSLLQELLDMGYGDSDAEDTVGAIQEGLTSIEECREIGVGHLDASDADEAAESDSDVVSASEVVIDENEEADSGTDDDESAGEIDRDVEAASEVVITGNVDTASKMVIDGNVETASEMVINGNVNTAEDPPDYDTQVVDPSQPLPVGRPSPDPHFAETQLDASVPQSPIAPATDAKDLFELWASYSIPAN